MKSSTFRTNFDQKSPNQKGPDIKSQLIKKLIPQIPFDGWCLKALDLAAQSLDLDPFYARELFNHKVPNLIAHYSRMADKDMRSRLEKIIAEEKTEKPKTTALIRLAIETRLKEHQNETEAVQRALSILLLPQNSFLATRLLYETTDTIWEIAGDTSTDYNRYSKRAILAGIYSATLIYWLHDQNNRKDLTPTMAFLDRRLGNLHQCFGLIGKTVTFFSEFRLNPTKNPFANHGKSSRK